jgi:hypothetical protein
MSYQDINLELIYIQWTSLCFIDKAEIEITFRDTCSTWCRSWPVTFVQIADHSFTLFSFFFFQVTILNRGIAQYWKPLHFTQIGLRIAQNAISIDYECIS